MSELFARGIEIKPDMRDWWLEQRRTGIGASEALAACGLDPYCSRLQLWMKKTGRLSDIEPSVPMRAGSQLEPMLIEEFSRIKGVPVASSQWFMRGEGEASHLFATLDCVLENGIVAECKTINDFTARRELGEENSDEIPSSWLAQTHVQMICSGVREIEVLALVANREFKLYRVPFSESMAADMIRLTSEFWQMVQNDTPPDDWRVGDESFARTINGPLSGEIELEGESLAAVMALEEIDERYKEAQKAFKEIDEERKLWKLRIAQSMGSKKEGILPDGRRLVRTAIHRDAQVINQKACDYETVKIVIPKPSTKKVRVSA